MEFKIDTKDTFTIITPVSTTIDANLAEELDNQCEALRQNGSYNFIVDMQFATEADSEAIDTLVALHEKTYGCNESIVFTGIKSKVMAALKVNELDLQLNVAPKMREAVDIICMEILERELYKEE